MPVKKSTTKRRSVAPANEVSESKKPRSVKKNKSTPVPNDVTKAPKPRKVSLAPKRKSEYVVNKIHDGGSAVGGEVFSMGNGDVGQLGLGPDIIEKVRPAMIPSLSGVIEVCAGGMHTVCLTQEGKVVTFGCNDEGALGRSTSVEGSETSPGNVELVGKVIQVTAGDSHSAVLLEDGRVFAWGAFRDSSGTMGLVSVGKIEPLPVQILGKDHPSGGGVKLASGADHLVILLKNGHILTCGCGEQGQLGRVSERTAGRWSRQGIAQLLTPLPVHMKPSLKVLFDSVWAGAYCTFAREKARGDIYVCGLNNYNQLGHPKTTPIFHPVPAPTFAGKKWFQISGGQHHTLALDFSGVPHSLGRKEYGRLGLGSDCEDATSPTPIPSLTNKKIKWVACGSSVSFAVTDDGSAFAWGMGTNYQLGFGDDESDVHEPKLIKCKQLEGRKAISVSGGGQHAVILATASESTSTKESSNTAGENSKDTTS